MKQLTLATLGAGGLAMIFASIGLLITLNMDYALARYPGSQRVVDEHRDRASVHVGAVGAASAYRAYDNPADVRHWYETHLDLAPLDESPLNPRSRCIILARSQQRLFVERSVSVTLCPKSFGTLIYVSQAIAIGH